jgi:hypothetical protein
MRSGTRTVTRSPKATKKSSDGTGLVVGNACTRKFS